MHHVIKLDRAELKRLRELYMAGLRNEIHGERDPHADLVAAVDISLYDKLSRPEVEGFHLPYRSECRCPCHADGGAKHIVPCCSPDPEVMPPLPDLVGS